MEGLNKKPLVSVIMPVYNAGKFLRPAIESILGQTYKHFELIIIDDASTDKSGEIISQYKQKNPQKIKVIRLKQNLNKGGDACANLAFQQAQGDYVARMDADDVALPDRLEKQVEYLLANSDVFMVGSQAWVIDRKGEIIGEKNVPESYQDILRSYLVFHPMIHPSIMLRKKMMGRKRLYKNKFPTNNDLFTFLELVKNKKFVNLPEKLIYYRIHGGNDSLTGLKEKYFNTLRIRLWAVRKLGHRPSLKVILMNLVQFLTIVILPEKALFNLYMLAKGIYKPEDIFASLKQKIMGVDFIFLPFKAKI